MGRTPRHDVAGAWHHVMNRGADRERIFFTMNDGLAFERLLAEGTERVAVEVHAYCLMPNHFHLLLHCPDGGLSSLRQQIGSTYSRRINARNGGDGPLFRSRFRSVVVDTPAHLAQAGRYIHRNPEDLSPPVDIVTYRWSSLQYYAGVADPPTWIRTSTLLGMCSGDYLTFVHDAFAA